MGVFLFVLCERIGFLNYTTFVICENSCTFSKVQILLTEIKVQLGSILPLAIFWRSQLTQMPKWFKFSSSSEGRQPFCRFADISPIRGIPRNQWQPNWTVCSVRLFLLSYTYWLLKKPWYTINKKPERKNSFRLLNF